MWVKICANTNLDDALLAVEYGADAVGFVFAPSKRRVTAAQVGAITALLPLDVERVGVFADWGAGEIAGAAREAHLTAIQLHGGVDLALVASLRAMLGPDMSIIHTVPWTIGEDDASAAAARSQLSQLAPGERVLLDAKRGGASGGLGVSFNWERAAPMLRVFPGLRFIVAGGLEPDNVRGAIATLSPFGVDVASGVELAPGRKDANKLRTFIENARLG